jgi:hypothetical protein
MAVITNNAGTSPMIQNKAVTASPNTPTKILDPLGVGVQPEYIKMSDPMIYGASKMPVQVIGLVPVFKCCDAATPCRAGWTWGHVNEPVYTTIRIILNGVILGTFNFYPDPTDTDADIQADIQAVLPAGYTCVVFSVNNTHRTVTIYSTVDSPDFGCGDLQILVSGGTLLDFYNFTENSYYNSPCDATCECKSYPADFISNPQNFALPVFASGTDCGDLYQNDYNAFLFSYPLGFDALYSEEFHLDYWDGIAWSELAVLNTSDYGVPYNNNFFNQGDEIYCTNLNYQGYKLDWSKIYTLFGENLYRFRVADINGNYCLASPPFCLKKYDCLTADGTVKFETEYTGGTFGSTSQQGVTWKFCCINNESKTKIFTVPINWKDSIRFYGFFGREQYEHQRDQIKYATGEIKKVRDELIKTFDLRTDRVPLWLHQRFAAYGMMANKLFVSDYNRNNANYDYRHFYIVADSGYGIDHKNYSRYSKVTDVKFKEGQQLIFKDNCC